MLWKIQFSRAKTFPCSFCDRNPQDSSKNWRGWQWRGSLLPRPPACHKGLSCAQAEGALLPIRTRSPDSTARCGFRLRSPHGSIGVKQSVRFLRIHRRRRHEELLAAFARCCQGHIAGRKGVPCFPLLPVGCEAAVGKCVFCPAEARASGFLDAERQSAGASCISEKRCKPDCQPVRSAAIDVATIAACSVKKGLSHPMRWIVRCEFMRLSSCIHRVFLCQTARREMEECSERRMGRPFPLTEGR